MHITIYGTGYVGLIAAVCFANYGHHVACYDIDKEKIKTLSQGHSTFYEPNLDQLFASALEKGSITFFDNLEEALSFSNVHFLCVGTPANDDGSTNLIYLVQAVEHLASHAENPFTLIIKSTVPVGTAIRAKRRIEEILIKREKEIAFHVVSCPEFLAQGSAVQNFLHPDRLVIGTESYGTFEKIKGIYTPIFDAQEGTYPLILHMSNSSAELTKYGANLYLATKISYMNEISRIAGLTGADIADTIRGITTDKRIGPAMANPGCGFGGSCLPKDLKSLIYQAEEFNYTPLLLKSVLEVNENQRRYFIFEVLSLCNFNVRDKVVAIWGLSFKPNTDDLRESISCELVEILLKGDAIVQAYDPVAGPNAQERFKNYSNFKLCTSKEEALSGAELLVVTTEWPEFRELDIHLVKSSMKKPLLVDGHHIYDPKILTKEGISYFSIGRGFISPELAEVR